MAQEQGQQADQAKQWGQIVAQAWADEAFKGRLLADPPAVLQEHGIPVPVGRELRVVEDTDEVAYLLLPPKPELTDEQLHQVAGGWCCACSCSSNPFDGPPGNTGTHNG